MSATENKQWLVEQSMLEKRRSTIERDLRSFYSSRKDVENIMRPLQEAEQRISQARSKENTKMFQKIKTSRRTLDEIKSKLSSFAQGSPISSDLQPTMEHLQSLLSSFRRIMASDFEALNSEERILSREIQADSVRFDIWNRQNDVNEKPKKLVTNITSKESNMHRNDGSESVEISYIDDIIRKEGGATGFWAQHEHDTFLRIWMQVNKGTVCIAPEPKTRRQEKLNQLIEFCRTALVDRCSEDVEGHFAWYIRYLDHVSKKRELVGRWRERKRMEKDEKVVEEKELEKEIAAAQIEGKQKNAEKIEKEREEKRIRIKAWQDQRDAAEAEKLAHQKSEAENRKQAEYIEKQRQWAIRKEVEAYRAEMAREELRREEIELMVKQEARKISQVNITERAQNDIEQAKARREKIKHFENQKAIRKEQIVHRTRDQWAMRVKRDSERLVGPTQASREAQLTPEDLQRRGEERGKIGAHAARVPFSARDLRLSGRAVPSWCAGISNL